MKDTILKSVEWAYPTSDNAKKFGFLSVGCWVVERISNGNPPVALRGYLTRDEAIADAKQMSEPWYWAFLKFNPDVR